MNWRLIKNIFQARHQGLLRLRPAIHPLHFECIGSSCARCCGVMGQSVVLSDQEAARTGVTTLAVENALVMETRNCACPLLKEGACSIYTSRPRGCQEYPWYNLEGALYYDAGCPGFQAGRDSRPSPSQLRPIEEYFPGLPAFVRRIFLRLMKAWGRSVCDPISASSDAIQVCHSRVWIGKPACPQNSPDTLNT